MIDVATYDYDFSSSLADGSVGITLIFTQQPEVAVNYACQAASSQSSMSSYLFFN